MISDNSWKTQTLEVQEQEHRLTEFHVYPSEISSSWEAQLQPWTPGIDGIKTLTDTSNKLLLLAQNLHRESEGKFHSMCQCRCDDNHMCLFQRDTFLQHLVFFPTELFSLHQRAKGQKARKPTPFGTWRQDSWLKLWPCMPRKKCKACYYTSRNPSWKEITSAFISVGIHSKECTHFVLLSQHLIIYMQNDIWFCHQVGNFVVLLFLLKQMIAKNSAESG